MNIGASLKVARNAVTSKAGRSLLVTRKHSPAILFGAGVIGVVATTVLASKATLKLGDVLDEKEAKEGMLSDEFQIKRLDNAALSPKEHDKELAKLKVEFIKDVAQLYAPAVVLGVMSIGALTGSHVILTRRNAALAATVATLDQALKDYRKRVVDKFGVETDREMMFGVLEDQEINPETGKVETVRRHAGTSMYARKFELGCSPWDPNDNYNIVFLKAQQQYANDILQMRGHLFLNEVYDSLGIERSQEGQIVGWVKGNADNYVSFGPFDSFDKRERDFVRDRDGGILLDFNVDGPVLELIGNRSK